MSESIVETPARAESIEIRLRIPTTSLEALAPFQKRAGGVSATAVIEKMIQRHVDAASAGCSLAPIPQRAYGIAVDLAKWAAVPLETILDDCISHNADQLAADPEWLGSALRKWIEEGTVAEARRAAVEENLDRMKSVVKQRVQLDPLKHAFKLSTNRSENSIPAVEGTDEVLALITRFEKDGHTAWTPKLLKHMRRKVAEGDIPAAEMEWLRDMLAAA
jgi:hypothetical protein